MSLKNSPAAARSLSTLSVLFILVGGVFAQHERQFNFFGGNGAYPTGGLVVDAAGNFYGVTGGGGSAKLGVVYGLTPTSNGAAESVLYNFTGSSDNGDGANPVGDLIFDQAGNLYGVTEYGGNLGSQCSELGCGTVFELSPPAQPGGAWTETVLYRFQGLSDGAQPVAGLVFDSVGNLYGTTYAGGIDDGVVFELSPPFPPGGSWTETVIHTFQGQPDGSTPMGGLVFDQTGDLYGTTSVGGQYGGGSVFELTPPSGQGGAWTETLLHSFLRKDGTAPMAGLAINPGGALFGTASGGGLYGQGTVFRLLPPPGQGGTWPFGVVHNFDVSDGPSLAPVTIGSPNILYGTTGGGTVFQISGSDGAVTYTVLYSLPGSPRAPVILHNYSLYGTTVNSGYKGNGTVYQLSH